MRTLVLYAAYTDQLSYYDDWLDAFKNHPAYNATAINVLKQKANLQAYELIVLHHSMTADTLKYLAPYVSALKNRNNKLVAFVGNEVNLPAVSMPDKLNLLKSIEPDIIATQLLLEAGQWLYADCAKSKIVSVPHALNPKVFSCKTRLENRRIDLGTRSAHYGVYLGDNDRNQIIDFFRNIHQQHSLTVDLGQNRFNRLEWCDFLNTCKATLSTEAGSFYLDKEDLIIKNILEYAKQQQSQYILPDHNYWLNKLKAIAGPMGRQIAKKLLTKLVTTSDKVGEDLDISAIHEHFFNIKTRCPVYSKAISSRHFDAIGTKTLHVMYPGRYNDILIPGEHYFELQYDHSNLNELLELLRDQQAIKNITDNVYNLVMKEHTHFKRLETLGDLLSA